VGDNERLLVALDEPPSSTEIVEYIGRIISGKPDLELCLLHMLPPPPPQLREFRGAEDPVEERELDREMDARGQRWTEQGELSARPIFADATVALTRAGVLADSIRCLLQELLNHQDLTEEILQVAKKNACQTIVVGRSCFPWFKEAFNHHVANKLVTKAKGMTVWVVERKPAFP
jgi:hypothetical protein